MTNWIIWLLSAFVTLGYGFYAGVDWFFAAFVLWDVVELFALILKRNRS